jgi:hypothetical protein
MDRRLPIPRGTCRWRQPHDPQNFLDSGRFHILGTDSQISHTAGPPAGGWTIVAVHESREVWEKFRDGILMPTMNAGISGGSPTPPQETSFEVYSPKQ